MSLLTTYRIYPLVKSIPDLILQTVHRGYIDGFLGKEAIISYLRDRDFTTIGLKPDVKYFAGKKLHTNYWLEGSEMEGYRDIAIKKKYTHFTVPQLWKLRAQVVTGNVLTIYKDRTAVIAVGDVINILDYTNTAVVKGQAVVQSLVYDGGSNVTNVVVDNVYGAVAQDICVFQNSDQVTGLRYGGFHIDFDFYDENGDVIDSKRETKHYTVGQALIAEHKIRQRCIDLMTSNGMYTDIQEEMLDIHEHYSSNIQTYTMTGDYQQWFDSMDSEADPTIAAYLDMTIVYLDYINDEFINVPGKMIDAIKKGTYKSY